MKKAKHIVTLILLVLLSLLTFHFIADKYPGNIVSRILTGASLVVRPTLIALIVLYIVNPFTKWLINKRSFKKKPAIITTMILLFIVVAGLGVFISWFLIAQGKELYAEFVNDNFIETIQDLLGPDLYEKLRIAVTNFINNIDTNKILNIAKAGIGVLFQALTTLILVPIFLWHFLNYEEDVREKIQENIPHKWHKNIMPIVYESNDIVTSYFRSKLLSMGVLFLMFTLIYIVLGLPIHFVILFAVLISLLDLIPYIGPTVGLTIPILFILTRDKITLFYIGGLIISPLTGAIILFIANFIIQFIQGNIIIPNLSGKELDIHPGLILAFMLFLGAILGVWGIILAIPLGGIIIAIWQRIKRTEFFQKE